MNHLSVSRLFWISFWLVSLGMSTGCPREHAAPGPGREAGSAPPTLDDASAVSDGQAQSQDSSPSRSKGYLVVGVSDQGFTLLDTTKRPVKLEVISVNEGFMADKAGARAVESLSWLGCGELIAARTKEKVAVWTRGGELLGEAPLPRPCRNDRRRFIEYLADGLASGPFFPPDGDSIASANKSCESVIRPGPLVVTPQGFLAMDPIFSFNAIGTEDDCDEPNPELRMPITIAGLEASSCQQVNDWPDLAKQSQDLLGESCAAISPYDQSTKVSPAARSWYDDRHKSLVKCLNTTKAPVDECLRVLAPNPDAGPVPSQVGATTFYNGGIKLCRRDPSGKLYVRGWSFDTGMGCHVHHPLWVIDDHRVVADTGPDARFYEVDGVWLYGGQRRWYVETPEKRRANPREFSFVEPSFFATGAQRSTSKNAENPDAGVLDQSTEWHCLCYSESGSDGQLSSATACRRLRPRCEGLEQKARNKVGSYANLQVSCRTIRAAHPADILGKRSQWEPSSIKGAWWVPRECLLWR